MGVIFDAVRRRKLGITKQAVETKLLAMKAAGEFEGLTEGDLKAQKSTIAITVMAQLQAENPAEWCEANNVGVDWDAILAFVEKLIEMLIPLIVKV